MPGGAASGAKGSKYERELVERFRADSWGALRLPSSGGATERELPDVLAGTRNQFPDPYYNDALWAVELKAGKATTLYVEGDEVGALQTFARRWGARPLLGARSTQRGTSTATYLVRPEDARGPTDGGRYGLPVADVRERAYAVVSDGGVRVL